MLSSMQPMTELPASTPGFRSPEHCLVASYAVADALEDVLLIGQYGSTGCGWDTEESDFDFLVISRDKHSALKNQTVVVGGVQESYEVNFITLDRLMVPLSSGVPMYSQALHSGYALVQEKLMDLFRHLLPDPYHLQQSFVSAALTSLENRKEKQVVKNYLNSTGQFRFNFLPGQDNDVTGKSWKEMLRDATDAAEEYRSVRDYMRSYKENNS